MVRIPQWQSVQDPSERWHWTCTTAHTRIVSAITFVGRAYCPIDARCSVARGRRVH
jgi:hypothetical protein